MTAGLIHPDCITPNFVPLRDDSLRSVEVDGEGVVYGEDHTNCHFLNPIAQIIWTCCDGSGSIAEISRDMSAVYGEDFEDVLEAVVETIRVFGHQGLLQGVEPTAPHKPPTSDEQNLSERHDIGHEPRFLPVPPSR